MLNLRDMNYRIDNPDPNIAKSYKKSFFSQHDKKFNHEYDIAKAWKIRYRNLCQIEPS